MKYEATETRIYPGSEIWDNEKQTLTVQVHTKVNPVGNTHDLGIHGEFCEAVHDSAFTNPLLVIPFKNLKNKDILMHAHASQFIAAKYPEIK